MLERLELAFAVLLVGMVCGVAGMLTGALVFGLVGLVAVVVALLIMGWPR